MLRGQDITQQFRIGNVFINGAGELDQVTSLDLQFIAGLDRTHIPSPKAEFVPINEGWLVRLGFEVEKQTVEGFERWQLGKVNILDGKYSETGIQIKYLHQLQNLYFALTGAELPVNINTPTRDGQ